MKIKLSNKLLVPIHDWQFDKRLSDTVPQRNLLRDLFDQIDDVIGMIKPEANDIYEARRKLINKKLVDHNMLRVMIFKHIDSPTCISLDNNLYSQLDVQLWELRQVMNRQESESTLIKQMIR